jgi:hypothetical protein
MGLASSTTSEKQDPRYVGFGSSSVHHINSNSSNKTDSSSLSNWKPGNNSKKPEALIQIVYINKFLAFACEEIFEVIRYSSVCRDWREAVVHFADEMWYHVTKGIMNEYGFQAVFLKILQSDQLFWAVKCCYQVRDAKSWDFLIRQQQLDQEEEEINSDRAMIQSILRSLIPNQLCGLRSKLEMFKQRNF